MENENTRKYVRGGVFPYEANDTMRMLGKQASILTEGSEALAQFQDIAKARPYRMTFEAGMDAFALGVIYGKRMERAKRARGGQTA